MLYKKKTQPSISDELFKNPTSEYRAAPFWAWNTELTTDLLEKEIEYMKEMGFGGFHMHPRVGMATEYLSDDFMALVRDCVEKARKEDMLAYLYDEDKWPSGFAGGYNTKDIENRQKILFFTAEPYNDGTLTVDDDKKVASDKLPESKYYLLACYDVVLDENGYMTSYRRIGIDEKASGRKWFAYVEYSAPSPWFNGQAYADTLQKHVIESFVKITHDRYKECVGDEFDKLVPSIFTDEPQFRQKKNLATPYDTRGSVLPFTTDFDDTFKASYGYSIVDTLPEVFFEKADGVASQPRYHYHDHIAERFASAFSDTVGKWCDENGIAMTGHMMQEPTLATQTCSLGDCMRSYRGFTIPGIDMLCDRRELTTAKQCQSAVHQYGREGAMSELYGVTDWDFDFKGHKLQGDWQAALGITLRVPHLFWVSMHGEAKRDYPASIGYQSPWYKEYKYIEDHFARVNTALTRGKPDVKIAVVHPVESYWLRYGPNSQTTLYREELESRFDELIKWLLYSTLDFDYICESLLPSQYGGTCGGLTVGKMKYDAVVVPSLYTVRGTTLDALEAFADNGGKVIFMGSVPEYVDALPSDRAKKLAEKCERIEWSSSALVDALESERTVSIRTPRGEFSNNLIYQLRDDGDRKYLFISNVRPARNYDVELPDEFTVGVKGEWKVTLLDTLTGEKKPLAATYRGSMTEIVWQCCSCDSLLLELETGKNESGVTLERERYASEKHLDCGVKYTLAEPNVLLLDMPRFSVNGGEIMGPEEILRADDKIRDMLGIRRRGGGMVQPWVVSPDKNPKDKVTLYYEFDSDIEYKGAHLALEALDYAAIKFNGASVPAVSDGYYVDEDSIKTVPLPTIKKGKNELEVTYRFGDVTQLEAMFVLGAFGVEKRGSGAKITTLPDVLCYGDITSQGLPFYGGNITYHVTLSGKCSAIAVAKFRGVAIAVDVDGRRAGMIAFTPHTLPLELGEGEHKIDLTLLGNRYNTFGALHNVDKVVWAGPACWRSKGNYFTYDHCLRPTGILTAPRVLEK